MPCETCNHTVQNIGAEGRRIFWCPQCGSLRIEMGDHVETQAPMLVERVKDAIEASTVSYSGGNAYLVVGHGEWLGIREAVGRKGEYE